METIEYMGREYQRSDESDGTTATAFIDGAEWMRKELTRWNDPKVILPPPDIQVIIKLKYKNGMICYAAARFSRKEVLWFYNQYSVCGVESIIGWREIHE